MFPRVSVVLPAWNAAATLPACLASIERQTLPDWECIVVDDGSDDGTRAVALAVATRDPRVRVVAVPHGGIVAALTEGLRHVRAPLVARMDADDLMHRDRLHAQVSLLDREPSLAAAGCHVRLFPRASMSPRLREYESWLNSLAGPDEVRRDAFVESPVVHPTLMMRREMCILGYRDCAWPEDYDLVLRALGAGLRIGMVPRRLLAWRNGPATLTRTDARYDREQITQCKAHYLAEGFLRANRQYVLWGYGDTGRTLRQALISLDKAPSHIVERKPSRIGNIIHGAPVIPPEALPTVGRLPIVVSVARAGPRAIVRDTLAALGYEEGRDYICAA
jgi:glycosyltransferase involved in cell wall biosynthesis